MAQITQSLIHEFRRALVAGVRPSYSLEEFGQLLFAWEELQRLKTHELVKESAPYIVYDPKKWNPKDGGLPPPHARIPPEDMPYRLVKEE